MVSTVLSLRRFVLAGILFIVFCVTAVSSAQPDENTLLVDLLHPPDWTTQEIDDAWQIVTRTFAAEGFAPLLASSEDDTQLLLELLDDAPSAPGLALIQSPLKAISSVLVDPVRHAEYDPAILHYANGTCTEALRSWSTLISANCALLEGDYAEDSNPYADIEPTSEYEQYALHVNRAWWKITHGQDASEELIWLLDKARASRSHNTTLATPEVYYRLADLHLLAFDYATAINVLTEYDNFVPNSYQTLTRRARAYLLLYEWDAALADYNLALDFADTKAVLADIRFQRGILYYTMAERENALADFQFAAEYHRYPDKRTAAAEYVTRIERELVVLNDN